MKRLIPFLCIFTGTTAGALTVYDPNVHSSILIQTTKELASFAEMIRHQVSQIQTLTDQLAEFRHYEELFGDPAAVVLPMTGPVVDDLRQSELGQSVGAVIAVSEGAQALVYNAGGLYHTVGATFQTPKGEEVARSTNTFRPFAAINAATANFEAVTVNVAARRVALKGEIARTLEQLRGADNAAEVAKLTGVLGGLEAALQGTGQEADQALATVLIQDIENRNDQVKQSQALKEEQSAAFSEAVGNFGRTFGLVNSPTRFPSR